MAVTIGENGISSIYFGSHEVKKAYFGNSLVYKALPKKGDIISMDLDGSAKSYRVIRINGSIAEVLCMQSVYTSSIAQTYAGSGIDSFYENTYYPLLRAEAQQAIVAKTFRQQRWGRYTSFTPGRYVGKYGSGSLYYMTLTSATFGAEITRHVYIPGVEDIIEYLGVTTAMTSDNTTLTDTNINEMFFGTGQQTSTWLNTNNTTSYGLCLDTASGTNIGQKTFANSLSTSPMMQIDLTKIYWL